MTVLYLVASTFLGLAAPDAAPAVEPIKAPAVPATAITAVAEAGTTPVVRVKRYCISDRREGAPRRPKICRTREDWQARGFDPLVAIGRL
ncbi:MAG: hypothetical protein PGN21_02035 [Sphingomonas paucimobilis]